MAASGRASLLERTCSVCRNLSRFRFIEPRSRAPPPIRTSISDVRLAASRACSICLLVLEAIYTFSPSLNDEDFGSEFKFSPDDQDIVDLYCSENGSIAFSLDLQVLGTQLELEIFTTGEPTSLPPVQPGVNLPKIVDLEYTVTFVEKWIHECSSHGKDCQSPNDPFLPSRVLDLGPHDNSGDVKLLITDDLAAPYAALSYCWGTSSSMVRTTSKNLTSMTAGLPWDLIPLTFQDAITLTKKLGLRYLWIDALCILQDDIQDWEKESKNMAQIYSNSYLTIAATSGSDCFQGLFQPRWTRIRTDSYATSHQGQKIPITAIQLPGTRHKGAVFVRPFLHLAHNRFIQIENADRHITDAPLLSRAWTFQERLLPAKTLHFHGEELLWECKSGLSCECGWLRGSSDGGEVIGGGQGDDMAQKVQWLKQWFAMASRPGSSLDSLSFAWLDLVSEFSRLHLTEESDRMPALSGLASHFCGTSLGSYAAGIWEKDLARGLLYERFQTSDTTPYEGYVDLRERGAGSMPQETSPTWSWSSINLEGASAISYNSVMRDGFLQDASFEVNDINLLVDGINPFSWATHGVLNIKGLVVQTKLVWFDQDILEAQLNTGKVSHGRYWSDERSQLPQGSIFHFLLVGGSVRKDSISELRQDRHDTQYVLVLQKTESGDNCFRRVGLLQVNCLDGWFQGASVSTIQLF